MSVPSLPLNKRFTTAEVSPVGSFDIENLLVQPTYTTIYIIPTSGDKFDPSTWTEAVTTAPVEPTFQFNLNKLYTNHYIYWSLLMRCETAAANGFTGVGIRWFDEAGNIVHNDGNLAYLPTRDTIYQEISVLAPATAVRGSLIWISDGNSQWSGNTARFSNFQRYIINWN